MTTARVERSWARKLSRSTCSKRTATASSWARLRGQIAGSPVEPDERAMVSLPASTPPRTSSSSWWVR